MKKTIKILIDVDTNLSEDEIIDQVFKKLIGSTKEKNAYKLNIFKVDHRTVEVYDTN